MKTAIGVFQSHSHAEQAVNLLLEQGFKNQISVLSKDEGRGSSGQGLQNNSGENKNSPAAGAWTGGVLGGLAGLVLGAGALAIPGIGPIIAAGPLAGAITGAVTGGVAGGLIDWGIPADRSKYYEGKVKEGKVLISVRSEDYRIDAAQNVLESTGATDVEVH